MASGGRDGGHGTDRTPTNLQGLFKFCTEQVKDNDSRTDSDRLPQITDEDFPSNELDNSNHFMETKSTHCDCNTSCDTKKTTKVTSPPPKEEPFWSAIEQARSDQDKALAQLDLYRYKIPGDGNCMFRAVASQLESEGIKQSDHPHLRRKTVAWMKEHADELLASGLLDSLDEIHNTSKDGWWPSQAALVAMANLLKINIAVIQGGDKGTIDIQHVTPFDTPVDKGCQEGVILAYLYNGHYDAVVSEKNEPNLEYKLWLMEVEEKVKQGEDLARNIERYGSSYGRDTTVKDRDSSQKNSQQISTDYHKAITDDKWTTLDSAYQSSADPTPSTFLSRSNAIRRSYMDPDISQILRDRADEEYDNVISGNSRVSQFTKPDELCEDYMTKRLRDTHLREDPIVRTVKPINITSTNSMGITRAPVISSRMKYPDSTGTRSNQTNLYGTSDSFRSGTFERIVPIQHVGNNYYNRDSHMTSTARQYPLSVPAYENRYNSNEYSGPKVHVERHIPVSTGTATRIEDWESDTPVERRSQPPLPTYSSFHPVHQIPSHTSRILTNSGTSYLYGNTPSVGRLQFDAQRPHLVGLNQSDRHSFSNHRKPLSRDSEDRRRVLDLKYI